jgi:UDP-N-acetylglucosamine--N-acetylmuramyl-(pentapeptide) pyrophosphoryl-undecaprenol N-acetylglucosamine transferase
MEAYFPVEKIVYTGNPIRAGLIHLGDTKQTAYTYFGLVPEKKCLLVLGGSLGAQTINESILQAVDQFFSAGLQIIWVTGHLYFEAIKARLTQQQESVVKVFPFIKSMHLAYAAADIVVSRAGALTVAELCMVQKPVVFVPSPHVTADHQTKNVLPLVEKNAALLVKDNEAMQTLPQEVLHLLQLETLQNILAKNMKNWAKPHATADIVQEIVRLAKASTTESVKTTQ